MSLAKVNRRVGILVVGVLAATLAGCGAGSTTRVPSPTVASTTHRTPRPSARVSTPARPARTATATPSVSRSPAVPAGSRAVTWPLPDQYLTPGQIVPGCTLSTVKARAVTSAIKAAVRARYHYTGPTDLKHSEIDHRVPHSLCGADTVLNLWVELPEPGTYRTAFQSNRKDELEDTIARWVHAGHDPTGHAWTLVQAQKVFLADWRAGWCAYFHKAGDGVSCAGL